MRGLPLPTHLCAAVAALLTEAALERASHASRGWREALGHPAVRRSAHVRCFYCGELFSAATNAAEACAHHPMPVTERHDSQGGCSVAFDCCHVVSDRAAPPCVRGWHHPARAAAAAGRPEPGDAVEVLVYGRQSMGRPGRDNFLKRLRPLLALPSLLPPSDGRSRWVAAALDGWTQHEVHDRFRFAFGPTPEETAPRPWGATDLSQAFGLTFWPDLACVDVEGASAEVPAYRVRRLLR